MATTSIAAVPGLASTSSAFRRELAALCDRHAWDADAIAAVMCVETGRTFAADAGFGSWKPSRTATGLLQFIEATARGLGVPATDRPPHPELLALGRGQSWSTWSLMWMAPEAQLRLVELYFARAFGQRVPSRQVDYYLAVLGKGMFQPLETVLYQKGDGVYEQNAGLDRDKDGRITVADMGSVIAGPLGVGTRLPLATDAPSPPRPSVPPPPAPEKPPSGRSPWLVGSGGSSIRVRAGDTLYTYAAFLVKDGARWREMLACNPGLNPRALRVGALLNVPESWRPSNVQSEPDHIRSSARGAADVRGRLRLQRADGRMARGARVRRRDRRPT